MRLVEPERTTSMLSLLFSRVWSYALMFQWLSANLGGGYTPIMILFTCKSQNKKCKTRSTKRGPRRPRRSAKDAAKRAPYNNRFRDQHRRSPPTHRRFDHCRLIPIPPPRFKKKTC